MFDSEAFDAVTGGDPETSREIAGLYATDSAGLLDQLRAATQSRDDVQARRLAHTLKSSSGSVGAHRASELAARIEHEGIAAAQELMDALQAAVAGAVEAMNSLIATR